MKKLFYIMGAFLLLASCTDDYKDWADPQAIAQPDVVAFGNGSVSSVGTVNLNNLAEGQTTVQVANITAPTATSEAFAPEYLLHIGDNSYTIDSEGNMSAAELQAYLASNYGRNPTVTRTLDATIEMWVSNGVTKVKMATSDVFQINAIAQAPVIEEAYYVTGNINNWDNTNTDYVLTNGGGDVYDNPVFTCTLPAGLVDGNYEFKLTPKSGLGGDWSKCITASETAGRFATDNAGENIIIEAVEGAKFYNLSFNMLDQTYTVSALSFDPFVYFIGATDGWSASDQKVASQGEGKYTGYVYIADPNGWGLEFKFQKRPGDWADDSQLNSNNMNTVSGDFVKTGDNFKANAGEGVYFVELDLAAGTLKGTFINNMNLVGDYNGWNAGDASQQMTWNPTEFCYEISGAAVTANGWKFTANDAWDINLGGSVGNLVANGDNLSVVGTTIKLYPTRKTSDNIYCTVE